jgi:hypothetical protein
MMMSKLGLDSADVKRFFVTERFLFLGFRRAKSGGIWVVVEVDFAVEDNGSDAPAQSQGDW